MEVEMDNLSWDNLGTNDTHGLSLASRTNMSLFNTDTKVQGETLITCTAYHGHLGMVTGTQKGVEKGK